MEPEYFWMAGMWMFPVIMLTVIVAVVYLMFGRGNARSPWNGSDQYHGISKDSGSAVYIKKDIS